MDVWTQDQVDVQVSGLYALGELEWSRDATGWSNVCYAEVEDRSVAPGEYVIVTARPGPWQGVEVTPAGLADLLRDLCAAHDYDPARCVTLARLVREPCRLQQDRRTWPGCEGCAQCSVPVTPAEGDELEAVLTDVLGCYRIALQRHDTADQGGGPDSVHSVLGPLRLVWAPETSLSLLLAPGWTHTGQPVSVDLWRARYHRTLARDPYAALTALEGLVRRGWVDGCASHPRDALLRRDVEPLLRHTEREIRTAALAVVGGLARLGVAR